MELIETAAGEPTLRRSESDPRVWEVRLSGEMEPQTVDLLPLTDGGVSFYCTCTDQENPGCGHTKALEGYFLRKRQTAKARRAHGLSYTGRRVETGTGLSEGSVITEPQSSSVRESSGIRWTPSQARACAITPRMGFPGGMGGQVRRSSLWRFCSTLPVMSTWPSPTTRSSSGRLSPHFQKAASRGKFPPARLKSFLARERRAGIPAHLKLSLEWLLEMNRLPLEAPEAALALSLRRCTTRFFTSPATSAAPVSAASAGPRGVRRSWSLLQSFQRMPGRVSRTGPSI